MTNDRSHGPYDPANFRTPPEGHPAREHSHRRRYDAGLVPAPVAQTWSGKFVLVIVLTAALSFFGAFWTIGHASHTSCEQRQELSRALVTIVQRSEPRLRAFYEDGTISKVQLEESLRDNAAAVRDLRFPPC